MKEILEALLRKNPRVQVVANVITLETMAELTALVKTLPVTGVEIVSVTAAKARTAGKFTRCECVRNTVKRSLL